MKIVIFFVCGLFLSFSVNARQIDSMPPRLEKFVTGLGAATASFTQTKTIPESSRKFVATGHVKFVKGRGFVWHQETPTMMKFTSTTTAYCIDDKKQNLSSLPYFGQIQSVVDDMLNGDMTRFLSLFNVDYTDTRAIGGWAINATPKNDRIGDFIKGISMSGNARELYKITVEYAGGTRIVIEFKRPKKDITDEIVC